MRVLLVEDEPGISRLMKRGLEEAGYTVDTASDGAAGLQMAEENAYSIILLDIMLPKMDGWVVCENLRRQRDRTPIMMLTARDTTPDKIKGLDLGADDYLPKPFDFQELLARVRALVRRDKVNKVRVIKVGDLEIDTAQHRVHRGGVEINLSHREYELLEALAAHESQVLSREAIQERVWMNEESYSNTVDVYIRMLRKKIDANSEVKLIHTVHGVGYTLRLPEAQEL
jgi:DNA-binding response OmpR family regulator